MSSVGRNQPCPCGSGSKFKKCCGVPGIHAESGVTRPPEGTYFRLRVSLLHATPEIWRRFLMRADASFFDLHDAIQTCGWTDSHLWHFVDEAQQRVIAGLPDSEGFLFHEPDPNARSVPLSAHFASVGDHCKYVYDFGDNWEHEVRLEEVEQRGEVFDRALLDGAGMFPPEDCGGIGGYLRIREFLKTGEDPWGEDEMLREWTDGLFVEDFDLSCERERFGEVLSGCAPNRPDHQRTVPKDKPTRAEPRHTASIELPPVPENRVHELDAETIDEIMRSFDTVADALGDKLGLAVAVRRASYHESNAKISIEVATIRDDGIVLDKHAEDFLNRGFEFGFEPEDLGRVFECGDETLRIIGLRVRANSPVVCAPVQGRTTDSRRIAMSAAAVRGYLANQVEPKHSLRLLPPRQSAAESE